MPFHLRTSVVAAILAATALTGTYQLNRHSRMQQEAATQPPHPLQRERVSETPTIAADGFRILTEKNPSRHPAYQPKHMASQQ